MSVIHICNAFFEIEIEKSFDQNKKNNLLDLTRSHPMVLQLQFLPLLYANTDDQILVSHLPENPDARLRTFDQIEGGIIDYWGASRALKDFLDSKNITHSMPDLEIVKKIHSKEFAFSHGKKLPEACLLYDVKDVHRYLSFNEPVVIKSIYGSSGRGHFFPNTGRNLERFLQKSFQNGHPVLVEPWVNRVLDFSTQWLIEMDEIHCLGVTRIENLSNGAYLATDVGYDFGNFSWAVDAHKEFVQPILKQIQSLGFFGNLGIDAFVYQKNGQDRLHPVVEINARKTMSYVALMVQKANFIEQRMRFSFVKNGTGKLPTKLCVGEKILEFSYNTHVQIDI